MGHRDQPRGQRVNGKNDTFFRLAGDTHLIAWPDISLLGENLRFKDTEYSEVESVQRKSRMEKLKGLTRWVLWKKTNTSCWNDLVILIGFLLSWWTLISNSKGSMGWLYIYLHENHPNSSIYAGYITIPYPWILWEWYLLGGGFKYLLPDPWHRMIR